MEKKKSRDTIQSLQLGISVINAIYEANRPLKLNEIQEKTKITKSNLYKYMNTLIQENLVFRDQHTGMYYLGTKLIQYGIRASQNLDKIEIITPYLQKIGEYSNCTVILAIPSHNGPVVYKIWRTNHIINIGAELGTILPRFSSSGKIFHAFADEHHVANWQDHEEVEMDEQELEQIKREKIAFANEPLIAQISSVSIPVLSFNNQLIGIITVVGFTSSIPKSLDEPLSRYLQSIQKEVSGHF